MSSEDLRREIREKEIRELEIREEKIKDREIKVGEREEAMRVKEILIEENKEALKLREVKANLEKEENNEKTKSYKEAMLATKRDISIQKFNNLYYFIFGIVVTFLVILILRESSSISYFASTYNGIFCNNSN